MRILCYIEPFPIRNTMTHFKDIARLFTVLSGNASLGDIRIYANRETLETLTPDEVTRAKGCLIFPTEEEQSVFNRALANWDEAGIESWQSLMVGGPSADSYEDVLASIWHRFPFEVIIHWGENGAIARFCKRVPAVEIAMELGCTRPPFYNSHVMDLFGTNGSGLLPKLSIGDIDTIIGSRGMSAELALLAYSENLESVGYEQQFTPPNETVAAAIVQHGGKVAFLPLQLYDDANLLLFSNYKTVRDVVLDVVPKLVDAGYLVLVKPHPASKFRGRSRIENAAARAALAPWRRDIVWCDTETGEFDNVSLIRVADVVVTVNSSVGFEATYFDKVVVVLGDAVYKPQGIFPSIEDVIEDRVDIVEYRHNLSILRRFMLESYLTPTLAVKDPSHFYRRILELVDISSTAMSPQEVAQRYYESFGRSQRQHQLSWMVGGISRPGISDFVLPLASSPAQIVVVPGVDPTFDQATVVAAMAKATGRKSKDELIDFLRKGWREPEFKVAILDVVSLFDAGYYLSENKDVAEAKMEPKSHFVVYGEAEGRNPHPAINLTEYRRTSNAGRPDQGMLNLLVHFIKNSNLREGPADIDADTDAERSVLDYVLDAQEEALVARAHAQVSDALAGSNNQIAVVAHLYYRDLVPELLDQLKQLPPDFDLIVTMPDWGIAAIEATVKQHFPKAVLCSLPNRGRDIGPFLEVLPHLIERQYSAVLKLQTKRGYYVAGRLKPRMGEKWRELTYQSLVGGAEQAKNIIRSFSSLPGLNLVGPAPFFLSLVDYPYHDEGELAGHYTNVPPARSGFFAGTMFWFRPKAFASLVAGANALNLRSFNSDNGSNDGQLAHLVERLFGHIAATSSMAIGAVNVSQGEYSIEIGPDPAHEKIHDFLVREIEAGDSAAVKSLTW